MSEEVVTAVEEAVAPVEGETLPNGGEAPATGTKPEGEVQTDQPDAKPEDVVPEKYEFVAAEGFEVDPAMVEAFTPLAKELKLTQAGAQKLADFIAPQLAGVKTAMVEARKAEVQSWADATRADADLGGAKLDKSIADGERFLKAYGTPALFQALKETGMANHPELIRAFAKAGAGLAEDNTHVSGGEGTSKGSVASKFYPGMNP